MSIFGEDDILGVTFDNLDDKINCNQDDIEDEDQNDENAVSIKIEPKKRSVRNLQPRLNVDRLKSDRGIHTLENYCKDIKFMGKGHEKHDLNNVMKKMEHWAHRLYPRFGFDDSLAAIEKLGKKRELQTYMTRYRLDMLEPELNIYQQQEVIEDDNDNEQLAEPFDEMDALLDEQISHAKTPRKNNFRGNNISFDSLKNTSIGSSILNTPRFVPGRQAASTPYVVKSVPVASSKQLTSEQVAKIAENRRLAQERLKAKREAAMAQSIIVEENSVIED